MNESWVKIDILRARTIMRWYVYILLEKQRKADKLLTSVYLSRIKPGISRIKFYKFASAPTCSVSHLFQLVSRQKLSAQISNAFVLDHKFRHGTIGL
jgi:hypothetical protein